MFKTISAALLAVSVLAAPALAATGKTAATRTTSTHMIKSGPAKAAVLNAEAKMSKHHAKHARLHRHHRKMSVHNHVRPGAKHKIGFRHPAHATTRRG